MTTAQPVFHARVAELSLFLRADEQKDVLALGVDNCNVRKIRHAV